MDRDKLREAVELVKCELDYVKGAWGDTESAEDNAYIDALKNLVDLAETVLAVGAKMPEKKEVYMDYGHCDDINSCGWRERTIDACTLAFAGMIPDAQYDCDHNGVAFVECTNDYEDGWNACRDTILSAMKGGMQ